jgi:DNA repair protein RecO (recombination protein O)
MAYLRDTVYILRNEAYREHDAWITMFGREHGKLVGVARGMRRLSAKQLGHLEPLALVEVMVAKGAAFDKVAVARTFPSSMRSALGKAAIAGAFSRLVDDLTREGESDPEIFSLIEEVISSVESLGHEPSSGRARFIFNGAALRLLDILGYGPPLEDKIFRFMRGVHLSELARLTAPADVLAEACEAIEHALLSNPLTPVRGTDVILSVLS